MIIRTSMANRGAGVPAPPKLSQREQKRLAISQRAIKEKPKEIEEVKEEVLVEEVREDAVGAQPIVETSETIAEPGTAKIRSKVLEEIENSYKKEPDAVPKKKYKVISIG